MTRDTSSAPTLLPRTFFEQRIREGTKILEKNHISAEIVEQMLREFREYITTLFQQEEERLFTETEIAHICSKLDDLLGDIKVLNVHRGVTKLYIQTHGLHPNTLLADIRLEAEADPEQSAEFIRETADKKTLFTPYQLMGKYTTIPLKFSQGMGYFRKSVHVSSFLYTLFQLFSDRLNEEERNFLQHNITSKNRITHPLLAQKLLTGIFRNNPEVVVEDFPAFVLRILQENQAALKGFIAVQKGEEGQKDRYSLNPFCVPSYQNAGIEVKVPNSGPYPHVSIESFFFTLYNYAAHLLTSEEIDQIKSYQKSLEKKNHCTVYNHDAITVLLKAIFRDRPEVLILDKPVGFRSMIFSQRADTETPKLRESVSGGADKLVRKKQRFSPEQIEVLLSILKQEEESIEAGTDFDLDAALGKVDYFGRSPDAVKRKYEDFRKQYGIGIESPEARAILLELAQSMLYPDKNSRPKREEIEAQLQALSEQNNVSFTSVRNRFLWQYWRLKGTTPVLPSSLERHNIRTLPEYLTAPHHPFMHFQRNLSPEMVESEQFPMLNATAFAGTDGSIHMLLPLSYSRNGNYPPAQQAYIDLAWQILRHWFMKSDTGAKTASESGVPTPLSFSNLSQEEAHPYTEGMNGVYDPASGKYLVMAWIQPTIAIPEFVTDHVASIRKLSPFVTNTDTGKSLFVTLEPHPVPADQADKPYRKNAKRAKKIAGTIG